MLSRSNQEASCLKPFLYSFTQQICPMLGPRHQANKNRHGICLHGAHNLVEKVLIFLSPSKSVKTLSVRSAIREKGAGLWKLREVT